MNYDLKLCNRVLLVSPDFLGLYKDIYHGLVQLGYNTEVVVTRTLKGDPFLVCDKNSNKKTKDVFFDELKVFWENTYKSGKYTFCYDYLIVIDGTCLHPLLFELLENNNPKIKKINYLFDGIETVYRFDRSFRFFDKIFTFDLYDSQKFNLVHLPIYWAECDDDVTFERDIFAFGSYNKIRSEVFRYVKKATPSSKVTSYIKLFLPPSRGFLGKIKSIVKTLMMIQEYGMITHKALSTQEFRRMIVSSRIIVDTSNGYQDGLTARFMWALGLGRKIITNNKSVTDYSFFTNEQIYIVGKSATNLTDFIKSDFNMTDATRFAVNKYRIDNWIKTLLE